MTDSLKNFCNIGTINNEFQITMVNKLFIPHFFDGETCWERCHPTFISKKRKVILNTS